MADCPRCGAALDPRVAAQREALEPPLISLILSDNPTWLDRGLCPLCVMDYMRRFQKERSFTPLHIATDPHTTFPYYHAREETVLGQPERLPDYPTFDGRGVTIAFLDSGFYPHPDLLASPLWPDPMPAWERLEPRALRGILEHRPSRLVHYVDLTEGRPREGLHQSSLWDVTVSSWHGQMTTVIAAGNGLLSGGRYRSYAPGAGVLPIKIGRSDGRIPEADILAGLRWLLQDNNWARYGVRVVNISVGGDYPQAWQESELALAAEQLSARGVLVLAAAGNSGRGELLPPAQSPSVLTVGGYDDVNRRWSFLQPEEIGRLVQYHHNFGTVIDLEGAQRKPELLGLARYVPSPILPGTPTFREVHAIAALRQTLSGANDNQAFVLLEHWQRTMHVDDPRHPARAEMEEFAAHFSSEKEQSLHEIWHALRKRMNAHKWVDAYYQHVDGTSVAVAQVSAVAAQMFQANPRLDGQQVKALLLASAVEMPQWPAEQRGAGIVQPAAAVAAALRAANGVGSGIPQSATHMTESRLRKWIFQGKVPRAAVQRTGSRYNRFAYFALYAPTAQAVSLMGAFNGWQPHANPLARGHDGWWHGALDLTPGTHLYRFWVVDARHPQGAWRSDPENPLRVESGFRTPHSVMQID